jgi:hypothetical protein
MKKRPELRIIISSATIDAEDFMEYFNTNAGGEDRTKDDAVSESPRLSSFHLSSLLTFSRQSGRTDVPGRSLLSEGTSLGLLRGSSRDSLQYPHERTKWGYPSIPDREGGN